MMFWRRLRDTWNSAIPFTADGKKDIVRRSKLNKDSAVNAEFGSKVFPRKLKVTKETPPAMIGSEMPLIMLITFQLAIFRRKASSFALAAATDSKKANR